ncbi:uncharacterized protein NESG_02207 [Nematocida ausubeli]|uniref:Uncharacterized protein n=1 Tax=Nematocida ausubeli (strain ATCC PRA-371 / ERTm2) TaxID=1913371 RepID=A0A086IZW5_NEMA1|nr:uncharacterized protein NESG_02207 [Nematocida ausubeli]KFG25433.1 hypothetical protein NESG_02207 [Nematocida ausubeli]
MSGEDGNHSMSIYDTVEHDMRHSKEYLANMKFNYIEVLHKSIFLKRLRGQQGSEVPNCKDELVATKKQIEEFRRRFEKISHEVSALREEAEKQESILRSAKEKETLLVKKIEEIASTEKTLKAFSEIKEDHEERVREIAQVHSSIEDLEKRIDQQTQLLSTKTTMKETLSGQKISLQERLSDLQKTSNQQLVYQYNWYKQFMSVLYKLVGIRVIDVRQSIHKHQETIYNSTEDREQKKKENTNEISVKLLSKQKDRTVVITLIFINGKLNSYMFHKTEGALQIEPACCNELFEYCKKVNSTKHFIFEGMHQQLADPAPKSTHSKK